MSIDETEEDTTIESVSTPSSFGRPAIVTVSQPKLVQPERLQHSPSPPPPTLVTAHQVVVQQPQLIIHEPPSDMGSRALRPTMISVGSEEISEESPRKGRPKLTKVQRIEDSAEPALTAAAVTVVTPALTAAASDASSVSLERQAIVVTEPPLVVQLQAIDEEPTSPGGEIGGNLSPRHLSPMPQDRPSRMHKSGSGLGVETGSTSGMSHLGEKRASSFRSVKHRRER